jgi:hypothetical protein
MALDTERCSQSGTDPIWRSVLDPSAAVRPPIADGADQPDGFLLYTTYGPRMRAKPTICSISTWSRMRVTEVSGRRSPPIWPTSGGRTGGSISTQIDNLGHTEQ